MKHSNFIKNSIIALLPISFALGAIFVEKVDKPTPVDAYDYTTLSKMDINLNDASSQDIRNYYSDLNDLTAENKKGTNLLKNLKSILSEGQKYFSYDNGKESIWRLYEIADRDWKKSGPTYGNNGTYDKTTNVIKGYTFGAGKSDESKNPYVHALYIDRSIDNPVKAWGNHTQDGTGINQEHIWAKSHGFDTAPTGTSGGARGDPMHLWAGNGWANNIHSNYYFGYVDKDKGNLTDTNTRYPSTVGHNYKGVSLTLGSGTVFEPQDEDKGDIARAIFYMAARYNNYKGATEGLDGNEPNLVLSNTIDMRTGTSSYNDPYSMGVLSDLLEWNKIDPPDEFEIHRNNLLYTNFTHNRNPFIDFPDWADICFGSSTRSADPEHDKINGTSEDKKLLSITIATQPDKTAYVVGEYFDPTGMVVKANYDDGTSLPITGYSWDPEGGLASYNDKITISYGGKTATLNITVKSSVIHPDSITISPNLFELEIDSTRRLTATVLPSDTTIKGIKWFSMDESIATVSSTGYVTAVGPGETTIIAQSKDEESMVFGSAIVTVPEPIVLDRIELSGTYKTNFYKGDSYSNKGIAVTAYYKQGSTDVRNEDVTDLTEFTGFDSSVTGDCTIYANYNGVTTSYTVHIIEEPVEENTVNFVFPNYEFENGQTIDSVTNDAFSVNFFGPNSNKSAYYDTGTAIRVYANNSFTIAGDKKIVEITFTFGKDDVSTKNLFSTDVGNVDSATGHWTKADGADSVTFTLYNSTSGHRRIKEIKVVYDDSKDATKTLLSITADGTPKTQFYKGDTFESTGLTINAHYSDFSETNVTSDCIFSGYDMGKTGNQTVVVSYTESGVTKSASYGIKVNGLSVVSIELSGEYKTTFVQGETFTHNGLVVTAINNSGSTFDATDKVTFSSPDMTTIGTKEVVVTYKEGVTASYNITVSKDPTAPVTVSKTILSIATENSWENQSKHTSFNLDSVVSVSVSGGTNTGKYYTNGYDWRIYQTESPVLSISVSSGYKLHSVSISFTNSNTGTLLFKGDSVLSDEAIETSHDSLFYYVGNSTSATNGQIKITGFEVVYSKTSPTPRSPEGIEISGSYPTAFFVGDDFSSTGLVTMVDFSNGLHTEVTPEITGYDMSKAGSQTVTVSYTENEVTKSTTYSIQVTEVALSSIEITSGPDKVDYFVGDTLDKTGLVVQANYNNGDAKNVNPTSLSGYDMDVAGEQTVTVTYEENGISKSDTFGILVSAVEVTSLELSGEVKTDYFEGEEFTSEGLVVTAIYNNGDRKAVTPTKITGYDKAIPGTQTIFVFYGDIYATYNVTVTEVVVDSISLSGSYKTTYFVNEQFSSEGLIVTASYNNGDSKTVTPTSITGYDMSKTGQQTIAVTYSEDGVSKSATYTITVNPILLEQIILSGNYKTTYFVGDAFSSDGLVVTAKYDDGSSKTVNPTNISGYNMNVVGEQTITVSYKEGNITRTATYKITIKALTPTKLTLSGNYKTEFEFGEQFDSTGLVVTVTYDNGLTKTVNPTSITGYNGQISGTQIITVSYKENGKTVQKTYEIKVKNPIPVLSSIYISGNYKTEFEYGENFSSEGLILTAHYSDGSAKEVTPTSITGYDPNKVGYQVIAVSYTEGDISKKTTYQVKVKAKQSNKNSNIPLIAGAIGGGAVGIGVIITIICVVLKKKH
ncbi:MAG: bacterial Ig-like domain-containing protein [Firmicutes bacterium]|nr:bacterial Ig-like domain-containing protein [Candidatus Fiminaster equi]